MSVSYQSVTVNPRLYDHYSTANVINGLGEIGPPYTEAALPPGFYAGAPASFQCATEDPFENEIHYSPNCNNRSIWYKFSPATSGILRYAMEEIGSNPELTDVGIVLHREEQSGDSTSLVRVEFDKISSNDPNNPTDFTLNEACVEPGNYFLYMHVCNSAFDLKLFSEYRPVFWIDDSAASGDYCETAVPVELNGVGEVTANVNIRCQSMGGDFGEDGSNMGCLFGPEDYKSVWLKLAITGDQKYDVTFDMQERTTALPREIRYRILYGDCSAMTAGPCNSDANTTFTLNCMQAGDYFVQVVVPFEDTGDIDLRMSSVLTEDQSCRPLDPLAPTANFTYEPACGADTIYFNNQSTQGGEINYTWTFPDGSTSEEFSPAVFIPRSDETQTVEATLVVINTNRNTRDEVTIPIFVPPSQNAFVNRDTTICDATTLLLDPQVPGAAYRWPNGSTDSTYKVTYDQDVWVEVSTPECTYVDSLYVRFDFCDVVRDTVVYVCPGGAYNGQPITGDTTVRDTTPLPAGNNRILNTFITVADTTYEEVDMTWCFGEEFPGVGIPTTDTSFCLTLVNQFGCDSTVCVSLSVLPELATSETITLCNGETVDFNGVSISVDTTLCQNFISTTGCDSLRCLTVQTIPAIATEERHQLCSGESFPFEGQLLTADTIICRTFPTAQSCDSIHCTEVIFIEPALTERTETICEGEFVTFGGQIYERDTMICDVLTGALGCDSTSCLNLTVIPNIITTDTITACEGEILQIGTQNIKMDTEVCVTMTGVEGCDSTHCITVQFLPIATTFLNPMICRGETFAVGNNSYTQPGLYEDRFTGQNGCDSIIITDLRWHENEPPSIQGRDVLCSEEDELELTVQGNFMNYRWLPGSTTGNRLRVTEPNQYQVIVTTDLGCLDTASLEVSRTNLSLVTDITSDYDGWANSCPGQPDAQAQAFITGGAAPFQIQWGNGLMGPTLDNLGPGAYSATVTDGKGCIASDSTFVVDRLPIEAMIEAQNPICNGENTGAISLSIFNANPPFDIRLNDVREADELFTELTAGDYTIEISDRFGCGWNQMVSLTDPPLLTISLPAEEITARQGDSLRLEARSSIAELAEIEWMPAEGLSCTDCLQPIVTPLKNDRYTIRVTDAFGCIRSATAFVKVDKQLRLFLPSAFSPDGDQQNDFFFPITSSQVMEVPRFEVFDRWGNRMYYRSDLLPPVAPEEGWDGRFQGRVMPTGVYVYWLEALLIDGRTEVMKGEVLLMR